METSLEPILIPQLAKAHEQTEVIQIREYLPDLDTLTPVQGLMRVVHRGNYLEVTAQAETIMTLPCDRCLQHYNYRLALDVSELIWLEEDPDAIETGGTEREVLMDELVESLSPTGFFHPGIWLYEQLCLEIPPRKLCDPNCVGIQVNPSGSETAESPTPPSIDHRWASLERFRQQLKN